MFRPSRILLFTAVAVQLAYGVLAEPPKALLKRATKNDLKYQPVLDYDTDSCYNVPAIGADGTVSPGLPADNAHITDGCRDLSDLDNSNAYSRQRCNSGWCAYYYDYYFEKDVVASNVPKDAGHRHDWEHVVVWVKDDEGPQYVAASRHGGFKILRASQVRWYDETHPKIVYHKDGGSTHAMRFANKDDDNIENDKGVWFRSDLVSYNGFPSDELRDKLLNHDFGDADVGFGDKFASNLESAIPQQNTDLCHIGSDGAQHCEQESVFFFDYIHDVGSPGEPEDPDPPESKTKKIMIMGDSITQGREGDFTWRYRLWQWLKDGGADFDFVGPFTGVYPSAKTSDLKPPKLQGADDTQDLKHPPQSDRYAEGMDPDFDRDHFAAWGRQMKQNVDLVGEQIKNYQPDVVIVMLGFNDMGFYVSDAQGTMDSLEKLVANIRKAKSDTHLLISQVPRRTRIDGRDDLIENTRDYNSMLDDWAKKSTQVPKSLVEVISITNYYNCYEEACTPGYDGLHPAALGEYQIARGVADRLTFALRIGHGELKIPDSVPSRDTSTPTGLSLEVKPYGFKLTWDEAFGAYGYDVESKYEGGEWGSLPVSGPRFDTSWAADGLVYSFRVRTNNGNVGKSSWSSVVSKQAKRSTLEAPKDIRVYPTESGLTMFWSGVTGATVYEVLLWDKSTPGSYIYGTSTLNPYFVVKDLKAGHRYTVGLVVWSEKGPSFPKLARSVVAGRITTPATPSNLKVTKKDDVTVIMNWDSVPGAGGYRTWVKSHLKPEEGYKSDGLTDDTSYGITYLFPGIWNYEFCVSAYSGESESSKSQCITPLK